MTTQMEGKVGTHRVLTRLVGILCFGLLAFVVLTIVYQIVVPPPAHRLILVQDIPLPGGLGPTSPGQTDPLAPGRAPAFDRFDFQAYDQATHRLFIAHTGPNPTLLMQAHIPFDPKYDGHILVFDTQRVKIIARLNIPQVAGLVDAPDLGKVFAADTQDNIVYDIDVHTFHTRAIQLDPNESPDAIAYDSIDKRIFVTIPPALSSVDRRHENIVVIDAIANKIIGKVNLGLLPLLPGEQAPVTQPGNIPTFGRDIGHTGYDEGLHRLFVVTQILVDPTNRFLLPPPGTGELMEIDPVKLTVISKITLPITCIIPHGLAIDTEQHIGFIACTRQDPTRNIIENLMRVDLQNMKVIPTDPTTTRLESGPDILVIDRPLHLLFVACKRGVTIFDIKAGEFHKLSSDVTIGKETHTIAVNEQTQEVYLPIIAGGWPILRIARYNPNGQ